MIAKLQRFAQNTDQPIPESAGQLVRCCLESLALCYAETFDQLESVLDRSLEVLHLVGGGIQNQLLNRLTCDALQKPIVSGPVEATAIGNLLVQAIGCGEVRDLSQLRELVATSVDPQRHLPSGDSVLAGLRERFQQVASAD